jgi:hypothetical protein
MPANICPPRAVGVTSRIPPQEAGSGANNNDLEQQILEVNQFRISSSG